MNEVNIKIKRAHNGWVAELEWSDNRCERILHSGTIDELINMIGVAVNQILEG